MDALLQEFPNFINNFKFEHGPVSFSSIRNHVNGCEPNNQPFNPVNPHLPNCSTSPCPSPEGDYPYENTTLKFIKDMLMDEEDLEDKPCMLQDCLALQACEKSLYDVLGQEYPKPSNQFLSCFGKNVESPNDSFTLSSSDSYPTANALVEKSNGIFYQPDLDISSAQNSLVYSSESAFIGPDFHYDRQPVEVPRKGIREARDSHPDGDSLTLASKRSSLEPPDKEEGDNSPNSSRGRKNHQREDSDHLEQERRNKHSALSLVESEPSELFDKVLLCQSLNKDSASGSFQSQIEAVGTGQRKGSSGRTTRAKKQGNKGELVDLWTLLTQCTQAVANGDQRTAHELLQQIRQHSSHVGDANQRLAHYFAEAFETRLAGSKTPAYTPILSNRTSAAEILKAYQVYVRACPFKRMSNFFANRTISKLAKKATRLHIIDFGILYGFQWPCLIQRLSQRPVGPPKLRITGIELPQPGFRPAERVEETGRRLEKYCERFNVPFEYNVIAKKWETIKYEELNIDRDEMIVVNCLYRLRNLPDDTVVANSARDTVLKLIHRIKPDIFIHGVINGTYNAPFFVTRFREALFHFSSLFDMFEANAPREDEQRMMFEKEIFGRDIMNVIACEGIERVERPETYRRWQARNLRAGFRQLPLDQEIFEKVSSTVKSEYNKDFMVDEDGQWMLQGWKGRIIHALSVWEPV